jgi:RNA polymerase sigma factor (sigma-70 family)
MSPGDRTLNAGSKLDPGSQAWMDGLRSPGAERDQALARLHDLMLRVARREVARRSGSLRPGGLDPDGLAGRAAADALRAITADLGAIQSDRRFTTWAAKYAVAAVAAAAAKADARRCGAAAQQAKDSGWDRLPGRVGLQPQQRAGWDEFAATLRRAVNEDLSDKQRRVFTAVTLDGVPAQVLAAGLGSSRNAIYKALFEARRRLRARLAADGHDPAHRSGNASACPRWAEAVLAADPGDAGCDFTFQLLDRHVEAELRGPGPGPRFPAVAAHLRSCQDCQQDCRGLLAAATGLMSAVPGS